MFSYLRLRVENFRGYRSADIPFGEGITVISGLNGRGKSTLTQEAPEWALFGKFKKDTALTSIRSRFSAPDSVVRVILDFELDGKHYTVERVLTGKNGTTASLRIEGVEEPLATGTKGVNEYVNRLFGFGAQVFTTSFIARQKELDALSDFRPEDRMKFFAKFAGVEALDKAKPQVRKDVSTARTTAETLRGQLPTTDDAAAALAEHRRGQKELHRELKAAQADLDKADRELSTHRAALREMEAQQAEHLAIQGQSQANKRQLLTLESSAMDLDEDIESLEAELEGYVPVEDIEAEIAGLESDRDAYRTEAQYGESLREARLNARALERDIAEKEKAAKAAEAKAAAVLPPDGVAAAARLAAAREAEAQAREERALAEARVRELSAFLGRVEAGELAKCPTCYTDFSGTGSEALSHVGEELSGMRSSLEEAVGREAAAASERAEAEAEQTRLSEAVRTREELLSKAEAHRNEAEGLRPSLERERTRQADAEKHLAGVDLAAARYRSLPETEAALAILRQQRQRDADMRAKAAQLADRRESLRKTREQAAAVEAAQAGLRARLKALKFDAEEFSVLRERADAAERARQEATERRSSLDRSIAVGEQAIARLQDDIARNEALREKVSVFTRNAEVGSVIDSVISLLRDDLAKRIAPRIAEHASRLLRDVTDGYYQNLVLDDAYRASVLLGDGSEQPLAQFSGGEQDVVNLCLRLGISQVILEARSLSGSLLVLDEVFGSQDEERRLAIVDAIGRLKAAFPQIVLITHIDDVKERADHIVSVERDSSGASVARVLS